MVITLSRRVDECKPLPRSYTFRATCGISGHCNTETIQRIQQNVLTLSLIVDECSSVSPYLAPGGDVPHPHGGVVRREGEPRAVGAPRARVRDAAVPLQRGHLAPGAYTRPLFSST